MTNNPDDTKARVNVDMALSIVNGTEHLDAAQRFVSYLHAARCDQQVQRPERGLLHPRRRARRSRTRNWPGSHR